MQSLMRNANSRRAAAIDPTQRTEKAFQVALFAFPPIAAWLAFSQSAREHALDVLLGQGACGNLFMTTDSPLFLGHCLACWSSGATAAIAAFLAIVAARGIATYVAASR